MVQEKDLFGFNIYYTEHYDPQNDDAVQTMDVFLVVKDLLAPDGDDQRYYARINSGRLDDRRAYLREIKKYAE